MSIEKITDKIIKDAANEAEAVINAAEAEAEKIIAEAGRKAQKLIDAAKEKGNSEEIKMADRRKSVADIDCRKLILKEKQDIIDECFDNAKKAIIGDSQKYVEFLASIVISSGLKSGEIIMNERDRMHVADMLTLALKKEMPDGDFSISEETRKIEGGLLIKTGKVYINGSLEGYADKARDELAADIAAKLFG